MLKVELPGGHVLYMNPVISIVHSGDPDLG
jgi:hypothetical protein